MDAMKISEILKEKGLKKSAVRIAVLELLEKSDMPVAEAEMRDALGDMYDRVTFYRTMQTLVGAGIVHRIDVDHSTVKYAFTRGDDAGHVHFYCRMCGNITCFHDVSPQNYPLPADFLQEDCDVIIKGVCDKCASGLKDN